MRQFLNPSFVVLMVSVLAAPAAAAEADNFLFEVYVQSVLYPETFDTYRLNHGGRFDARFQSHLRRVVFRMARESKEDLDYCNQQDPKWRSDCLQIRPAGDLLLWCLSLDAALESDIPWAQTDKGSLILVGKRTLEQLGVDYETVTRMSIGMMEPFIRSTFKCT